MAQIYLLPADRDPGAFKIAQQAAEQAFPKEWIRPATNVDELLLHAPINQTVLLVMIRPTMDEVQLAAESVSLDGLPRFGLVVMGGDVVSNGAELVPEEEWSVPLLRHVMRGAFEKFELAQEGARFRGDLHTVARRISHDLRTPLSGIFTTAELLHEILSDHSEEDAALVTPLYDSTQAVLKLIERVSFVAKATVEPRPKETVEMDKVVWAARQGVERLMAKTRAQMDEVEEWPQVQGITAWLEVIWGNLMTNAVQHGGEGVQIKVEWSEAPGEYLFWVRDNGRGVPEEKRGSLFQPFHRLHLRNSAHGLGLAIVQRLVELQGGRCGYQPQQDGGAGFYFTLPNV